MAIGCGPKIAKFILFVFNVLFWITGAILIILGGLCMGRQEIKLIDQIISSQTSQSTLIGLIILGVIIFVIGFCGCCGAIKESKCLLGTYIILVVLIIVGEVIVGIVAVLKKNQVMEEFSKEMDKQMQKYGSDPTTTQAIDKLQAEFKCCGTNGTASWKNTPFYVNHTKTDKKILFPVSCCANNSNVCNTEANKDSKDIFKSGCTEQIEVFVKQFFPIIIGVALGIAFFEIFVVICAICLCRNTGDESRQTV